jgi:hypothetical protein
VATRLVYETFNAVTTWDSGGGNSAIAQAAGACYAPSGSGLITPTTNPSPSPTSGGKCIHAVINANTGYSQPALGVGGLGGITEIYLKIVWQLRNFSIGSALEDLKFLEISNSSGPIDSQTGTWFILQRENGWWNLYSNGGYTQSQSDVRDTGSNSGLSNNVWTTTEVYIKYNTGSNFNGILQTWDNGSLQTNKSDIRYNSGGVVINCLSSIFHCKSLLSGPGAVGDVYIDDFEVWNGIPTGSMAPTGTPVLSVR